MKKPLVLMFLLSGAVLSADSVAAAAAAAAAPPGAGAAAAPAPAAAAPAAGGAAAGGGGMASGGAGGAGGAGGGGAQVGFLSFSMAATSLSVPPLSEPKTRLVPGIGTLATIPHYPLTIDLSVVNGEVVATVNKLLGKTPDMPAPAAPPTNPAGGGKSSSLILQGLTNNIAESTTTTTPAMATPAAPTAPTTRGIASTRLLSSLGRAKAKSETPAQPPSIAAPSRGLVQAKNDGFIKVFRSIKDTYGWDPGTAEAEPDSPPLPPAGGHKR